MNPNLIKINLYGFEIGTYAFFIIAALLIVTIGTLLYAKKRSIPLRASFFIIISSAISAALGARVLHVLINKDLYSQGRWSLFDFSFHGFSLYGGLLAGIITGLITCKIFKINIWKMGDTFAPFIGIGIAVMRIGCYLKGCCFGHVTDVFWAVKFPLFSPAHMHQLSGKTGEIFSVHAVHPTQIYELLAALTGSLIAYICIKKKMPNGFAILCFGLWFTIFRFINYFLRVPPNSLTVSYSFYPIFYVILISMIIIISQRKFRLSKVFIRNTKNE